MYRNTLERAIKTGTDTRKGHGSDSTLLVYNAFRNMLLEILYLAIATAVLLVPAGSSSCGGDVVVYV